MKKLLIVVSFVVASITVFAQEPFAEQDFMNNSETTEVIQATSSVFPMNSSYLTLNAPVVNERQMMGFMQSNSAVAREYDAYQRTAIAGWVLFSVGVATTALGIPIWIDGDQAFDDNFGGSLSAAFTGGLGGALVMSYGIATVITGVAVTTAGIICLGVGYGMRGGKADLTYQGIQRQRVPVVRFDLQSSSDGLGIAMKF